MANQEVKALHPYAAVLDALIVASGKPNSRNRRRLHQAQLANSRAMTERLFGTGSPELLVGAV